MAKPPILDRMKVLSDPIRSRILILLGRAELTVSELCHVLQLPQSTVSRHLKVLSDDGWTTARRDGTNRHYSMTRDQLSVEARELWALVQSHLVGASSAELDRRRLESVLERRRSRSREYFDRSAGEWDETRCRLFGERVEWAALFALIDERWVIGDLGCGTGRSAELMAPHAHRIIAVDASTSMLEEARLRLEGFDNVDLRPGELEQLPVADSELDAALLILVLHHLDRPQLALAEVARALRPDGRLVILDMLPHDRDHYQQEMGHVWLGFAEAELAAWLEESGFGAFRWRRLPPDPDARGPMLFLATARLVTENPGARETH